MLAIPNFDTPVCCEYGSGVIFAVSVCRVAPCHMDAMRIGTRSADRIFVQLRARLFKQDEDLIIEAVRCRRSG